MYVISTALTDAQKAAHGRPYVELKAREKIADVNRLRFTRHYTGAEADKRHGACMPADGSLLRARMVDNGAQRDIGYSRVVSPAAGSTYSSWSTLISDVDENAGVAFAARSTSVLLFYVDVDGVSIRVRVSTDSGATYAAYVDVVTAAGAVKYLAAAYKDASTVVLFFATATTVYWVVRTSGTWGAAAAWTNTANSITGLAVKYQGDFNLAIAGTDTDDHAKVWACLYGDGYSQSAGAWSGLLELMHANNGSGVTYSHCSLGYPDVYRMMFLEEYSGTGAYTYSMATHFVLAGDFVNNLWREPWPLGMSSDYGLAIVHSATRVWITTPAGVWSATLSVAVLDLTADVLRIDCRLEQESGSLIAVVRNDSGQYLESGSGKGQDWLGCQLDLGFGYFTTAGNEATALLSFWVDQYEMETGPGSATLVLRASGPWELLERWRARRQYTWAAGARTVYQLIGFVLARAGFDQSSFSTSSQITTLQPAFTISPGESAASTIKRLLAMVPDVLIFENGVGYILHPEAADSSQYSYGGDHAILKASYQTGHIAPNRVQVYADGALGEAIDWTHLELEMDSLEQQRDANLTTEADADDRAGAALRHAAIAGRRDQIITPPNCALELYDVVDITDSRAGLSAAKRRTLGIHTQYDAMKPVYRQIVILGEA